MEAIRWLFIFLFSFTKLTSRKELVALFAYQESLPEATRCFLLDKAAVPKIFFGGAHSFN